MQSDGKIPVASNATTTGMVVRFTPAGARPPCRRMDAIARELCGLRAAEVIITNSSQVGVAVARLIPLVGATTIPGVPAAAGD